MASQSFECVVVERPDALVLHLRGEIRLDASASELEFTRLVARRPKLAILDLSALSFISSLGMGQLVALSKGIAGQGGTLRLAAVQPFVRDALDRVRLWELLKIFPTIDAAIVG